MLAKIIKAIVKAILEHLKEQRLERDYQQALIENERFDEQQRRAEAARKTTEAVLHEAHIDDDIDAIRRRLRDRAEAP